jgi:hypothetical protein
MENRQVINPMILRRVLNSPVVLERRVVVDVRGVWPVVIKGYAASAFASWEEFVDIVLSWF